MSPPPRGVVGAARLARGLARCVTAAAVVAAGVSLYTMLVGAVRLHAGFVRVSAGSWPRPLMQAVALGAIAAWLFHRDASMRGEWDVVPRAVRRFFSGTVAETRRRVLWTSVLVGVMASLVVCSRLVRQSFVVGSADGGWAYPFVRGAGLNAIVIFALASVLGCAALMWRPKQNGPGREWDLVFAWVLVATGLQALIRSLTPWSFEQIVLSEGANSFYTVTQQYGASSVLSDFNRLRDGWPLHAHSNMPGKLILLYALELISNRPAALAWLLVVVSNLGGVFLYLFVRDLFADRRVALYSLVLYFFVPGKLFFFPLMNTVTPAVGLGCAVLVLWWLQTGRAAYAAAAGAALFGLVFFEPLPLVLGVLFAILALRAVSRGDLTWRRLIVQSGLLVLAFVAAWVVVRLASGFDLVDAFRRVAADAEAFNVNEGRPYGVWVRHNVTDFLFGAGVCQAVVFWAAFGDGLRANGRSMLDRPVVVVCAAVAVMVLAFDLAGVNRGEVIRLWIFLACLFQIPTAYACAHLNNRAAMALVLTTTIIQAALGTSMIGFIVP